MVEGRFSKWFWRVKKGVLNLSISISMAYNVISCRKVAENTQILKIAKLAVKKGALDLFLSLFGLQCDFMPKSC